MRPCIFCEIVAARLPASIVWEDDLVIAFLDLHPVAPGHTLIVPRRHVVLLPELDAAERARLLDVAVKVRAGLAAVVGAAAANLLVNDGKAAWQHVPHLHLHVVPRTVGDSLRVAAGFLLRILAVFGRAARRDRLDALAVRLRSALDGPSDGPGARP